MIKDNELRLGNWFYPGFTDMDGTLPPATVKALSIDAPTDEICLPIPLTSALLEQCGFEKTKHRRGRDIWIIPIMPSAYRFLQLSKITPVTYLATVFEPENEVPLSIIKYVHQLQNITFALTGKELEISL